MSEPLTATSKLEFEYTVTGLVHRVHAYMAYNDVLGQHQMVDRDGITTVLWTLGAQYLWDKVRALYPSAAVASPAQVTLLQRSGIIWNVVDIATLTGAGTNVNPYAPASQGTWVVRASNFKFIRFILLETAGVYVGHFPTGISGFTVADDVTKMLNGVDTNANAPFRWMKNRSDHFIAGSGQIAGFTWTSNDRVRRARGFL